MPDLASNLAKIASETDVNINITSSEEIGNVVKTMTSHVTTGLKGLTDGLTTAAAGIVPLGMTLFAIGYVPRWGMRLFKAIH